MPTDFSKIVFDPSSHTYTYDRKSLISVTTILKWITPEFDTERMLKQQSRKTGRNIEDIRKEWNDKRDAGLDKGTRVHNYVENVLEGNDITCMTNINPHIHEMKQFDIAWARLKEKLNAKFIRKEWTIGDAELGVAGRIDALISLYIKDKHRKCLFDWKTGKFMTRKYTREYMLPPFDDLPACEEIKYSLQLSLYRLILDRNSNEDIYSGYIMHLPSDEEYQLYNVIDLRPRVEKWLLDMQEKETMGDPNIEKDINKLIKQIDKIDESELKVISPHTKKKLYMSMQRICENIS